MFLICFSSNSSYYMHPPLSLAPASRTKSSKIIYISAAYLYFLRWLYSAYISRDTRNDLPCHYISIPWSSYFLYVQLFCNSKRYVFLILNPFLSSIPFQDLYKLFMPFSFKDLFNNLKSNDLTVSRCPDLCCIPRPFSFKPKFFCAVKMSFSPYLCHNHK